MSVPNVPRRFRDYLRPLASLQLAVIVLGLLAVVLAAATIYESNYGTAAAQRYFYQAWWFDLILLLLGVNVAAAAISRWPWKPRHVGFLVTHLGILVILGGCLTTHWRGIEGRLALFEGQQAQAINLQDSAVVFWPDRQASEPAAIVPLGAEPRIGRTVRFELDGQLHELHVANYLPDATVHEQVIDGGPNDPPAIRVRMQPTEPGSPSMAQWLFLDDPTGDRSIRTPTFTMEYLSTYSPQTTSPKGILTATLDGRPYEVDVARAIEAPVLIADGKVSLRVREYYTHATVAEGGGLREAPDRSANPAVIVEIVMAGHKQVRAVFALFGDVGQMHGHQSSPLKLGLRHPAVPRSGLRIAIVPGLDGLTLYEADATGPLQQAELTSNPTPLKSMPELSVALDQSLPHARTSTVVTPASRPSADSRPAVDVEVTGPALQFRGWLAWGQPREVSHPAAGGLLAFQAQQAVLPFTIGLERFDLELYPGTNVPRQFRSRVVVTDPTTDEHRTVNIEMNKPLHHEGWTFFQSSYNIEGGREMTVLQVTHDPGKNVVYTGSILLVLGTVILAIQRFASLSRAGRAGGAAAAIARHPDATALDGRSDATALAGRSDVAALDGRSDAAALVQHPDAKAPNTRKDSPFVETDHA